MTNLTDSLPVPLYSESEALTRIYLAIVGQVQTSGSPLPVVFSENEALNRILAVLEGRGFVPTMPAPPNVAVSIAAHNSSGSAHSDLRAFAHYLILDSDAEVLLDYNSGTSTLGLDVQDANKVFAGPAATGSTPDEPTFRTLVGADIPWAYRSYVALLSQSGTQPPVATVLEDTLGDVPVWSHVAAGAFDLTLAGAFPEHKTWISPSQLVLTSGDNFTFTRVSDDILEITAGSSDGNIGSGFAIEIRVYP